MRFLENTQLCGSFPLLCCHVCTSFSGLCTPTSRLQTICFVLFSLPRDSSSNPPHTATLVRDTFSPPGGTALHCTARRCMFRPAREMPGKSAEAGSSVFKTGRGGWGGRRGCGFRRGRRWNYMMRAGLQWVAKNISCVKRSAPTEPEKQRRRVLSLSSARERDPAEGLSAFISLCLPCHLARTSPPSRLSI